MKTILIFSLFLAVTLAGQRREEIKEAAKACGATNENLRQKVLDENADPATLGPTILCVNKKIGVQKDNGDINKEVIRKDLEKLYDDETKVNKIVEECGKPNGGTPEIVAFNFLKCTQKNVPVKSN